jgi:hypothetical protein
MDATQFPDVTKMTIEEAKAYILESARRPGDSHDVYLENLAHNLLEAAKMRREAEEHVRGGSVRIMYSNSDLPEAPATSVLYDAAWELVREGVLRPGPRCFGVLNERSGGFSLTAEGKRRLQT